MLSLPLREGAWYRPDFPIVERTMLPLRLREGAGGGVEIKSAWYYICSVSSSCVIEDGLEGVASPPRSSNVGEVEGGQSRVLIV
jgi:hypothetical protein